jgi:phage terminase large subunit-like protein
MRRKYRHVTVAKRFAREVVAGKRVAGKWVKLACQRFLDDLERGDLTFDPNRANRACRFLEKLHHVKGRWARSVERIVLEPWQSWFVVNLFGFVNADGTRRFREAYLRVARKNAKSTLAAGIGLYCLVEDNEYGAEVYSGATSEAQALEVFSPARKMAQKHAGFASRYGVEVNAKSIAQPETGSTFKPLIGKPGDGMSPSCALIDEFHEHTSWDLYEAMDTGMGAREQPLKVIITTAGDNIASPCFEKDTEICRILDGTFRDDTIFGVLFCADEGDEWTSVAAMKKANPNLGVSVARQYLDAQLQKAKRSPSAEAAYKTKNLNLWVQAGNAFISSLEWAACGSSCLRLDDYIGKPCVFGVDLASRIDVVALLRVFFEIAADGNLVYTWFPRLWLPANRVDEEASGQYKKWLADGHLEVLGEDEIDFAALRREIKTEAAALNPVEIAFDPWRASGLEQELTAEGLTMVKVPQVPSQFTSPLDELEAAITGRRFHHPNNGCLNWMAMNLTVKEISGGKKPFKPLAHMKNDGMMAGLMGINRALAQPREGLGSWLDAVTQ